MEAMATVVARDPVKQKAAGISAHAVALLKDGNMKARALCQPIGRPGTSRTGAQDHNASAVNLAALGRTREANVWVQTL